MGQRIVSEIDIPLLAEAMDARGYALELVGTRVAHGDTYGCGVAAILRRWVPGIRLDPSPVPEIALARCGVTVAAALDAGAADAVAIPVDATELAARVDARVRFHQPRPMVLGDLRIDPVTRRVWRAGVPVELVAREFALLLHLAEHAGDFVTRSDLLASVWNLNFDPGTNVVAVHVSKLRAKLDRHFPYPVIHSAKGLGYRLDPG